MVVGGAGVVVAGGVGVAITTAGGGGGVSAGASVAAVRSASGRADAAAVRSSSPAMAPHYCPQMWMLVQCRNRKQNSRDTSGLALEPTNVTES
eukprot:13057391-Alexandrium_andersonii.AAC.1